MAAELREAGCWLLEREIGSGSFAKVWKATHQQTQQVAAVKEINLDKLSKKLQESLASEVAVLKHTQHHNIVCLLDLIKDTNRLFLVLEFCAGGDLGHYLRRYRQVSEATARYFLQQIAEGLKELRRHNVIHRDLKPQNLLLSDGSSTPLLKIADFGFARSLAPQGLAETLCGSPLYMAPEILQFQKYDAKADLWSIGTILYELLVGKPPYNGANHIQLLRNIEKAEARLPDHIAARLSPSCKSLLGRLLQRNPVERMTFEEFFTHPFLAGDGHAGPCAGIPPPQLVAVASSAAAGSAVPAAMRQAAAAAVAAASGDARQQRPGSGSVAKPQLHLVGGASRQGAGSHAAQQQQQLQHNRQPHWQQQQQPNTPEQYQHLQQQQLQQQHLFAGLVSRPVSQHPLAAEPPQQTSPGDVEALSDSMEGDFVVVYTPQSSSTPHTRSSNSSSKASSGLADPKAAAVLQGMPQPPARRPWQDTANVMSGPQQQQQQQQLLLQGQQQPAYRAGVQYTPQHTGLIPVSTGPVGQYCGPTGGMFDAGLAAGAAGAPAASVMQHSSLQMPATPLARVQLLVQVVRGCVSLVPGCDGNGPRDTAGRPTLQQAEQLAVLLLALQVVQLLCCPEQAKATEEQQQQHSGGSRDGDAQPDLASVLAAASQSDVEQLMAAVVDLLQLAEVQTRTLVAEQHASCGGQTDGPGGLTDTATGMASCQALSPSITCWNSPAAPAGSLAAGAAAASHMIGSLMQAPVPDPAGVLYHAALESCRGAAVEEVMGNWRAALDGYSLAADLLLFLSQPWPELPAPADPALLPDEHAALHRLYTAVNNRLTAVVAEAPPEALTG